MDVLLDRHVNFVDEVEEIIQERGGQTRDQTIASIHATLEEQIDSALDAAIARHEAEVEAPAVAILRERKAAAALSRTTTTTTTTSGWRKEPVTFASVAEGFDVDAGYYRELLDGVDPVFPEHLAAAPAVNSLTIRVSWPPRHCAAEGFIASAHEGLLALCVGSCRHFDDGPHRHDPGCYLVLDTRAKSVAVVPPLPFRCAAVVDGHSHSPISEAGVAVLRTDAHDGGAGGYLLAELYRHTDRDTQSCLSTNTATLFTWRSPGSGSGSGAGGGQWIRKEVVLPLPVPVPGPDEYWLNFGAGTVFAVSSTSVCWVDVWAGILVCDNISSSSSSTDAGGGDDHDLLFRFIPLPEECAPASFDSTEFRSVCCVDSETIKLLCMDDGGGEDDDDGTTAVTTWTLRFPLTDGWRWEKDEDASCSSLCVADLLDDAIPVDGGGNRRRRAPLLRRVRWPVVGRAQPGVVHVYVLDFEYKRKDGDWEWEARRCYEVSLDVPRRRVTSVFTFPELSSPTLMAL